MTHEEIRRWLAVTDPPRLEALWRRADDARRDHVGDAVHLRGLVEMSNHCVRHCAYCGINACRSDVRRYRMTPDEALRCARRAAELGYGTLVVQAGEDPRLTGPRVADLVRRIKTETPLAVTLSLGERPAEDLDLWRAAGADRYLLRFETTNERLFARLHDGEERGLADRLGVLRELRRLGYEVGSGCLIGLPGQTFDDLARDVALFRALDLDMIGCGPFVPHPDTPLGREAAALRERPEQVPADATTARKVVALARLVCPDANIPATTAVATLDGQRGYESALGCGANVIMPNLTPAAYRALYEIYPGKAGVTQPRDYHETLKRRIASLGRHVANGPGPSPKYLSRSMAALKSV